MGGAASKSNESKAAAKAAIAGAESVKDHEAKVKDTFKAWDADGNGTITPEELEKVFATLDPTLNGRKIVKIFKEIDTNKDGMISYEEMVDWLFCAPSLEKYFQESGKIMRKWFKEHSKLQKKIDKVNRPGCRTKAKVDEAFDEFKMMQDRYLAQIDKTLTPIIKESFAWHDKDGSGKMEVDESIIFFSNFIKLAAPFMDLLAEAMPESFKEQFCKQLEDYKADPDPKNRVAFNFLKGADGKVQESEVVEALLHSHDKNQLFMKALGFPDGCLIGVLVSGKISLDVSFNKGGRV